MTGRARGEGRAAPSPAREVAWVFLRMGATAFGGPAAHTALMRDELVRRRGWVGDQRFADLIAATNLIPGPNSTELAIHLGYDRARWRGMLAAGVCFIVPAAAMVTALAWAYTRYGVTPAVTGILYGVVPAVIAVIGHALVGLTRSVVRRWWPAAIALAALAAYLFGVNELAILAGGAALAALGYLAGHPPRWRWPGRSWLPDRRRRGGSGPYAAGGGSGPRQLAALVLPVFATPTAGPLWQLTASMFKIGAVLYGSGYVLLAFLRGEFVVRLGWITDTQLVDAVSIGQVTPGPVFTTATFIGYLVAGLPGAFLATVAIFTPSFLFVGLLTRITDRLRATRLSSAVLDGVNAAALALMAGVSAQLARTAIVDVLTAAIAVATVVALWRTRWNSAWFLAAGAAIGLVHQLVR